MQRTPAWHAARKGKLTASNIGAAMGLCSWTSRQQAFNRAMGTDTFVGNDATKWGVANESNGILAYTSHTGNVVEATGIHVHADNNWLAGSPDGLIGEEGLIEVKCPYYLYSRDGNLRGVHKVIPSYYYLQMQLCLECTNRKWCDYVCWTPEEYCVYRVTRDENLHELMLPYYLKFFGAMSRNSAAPPAQSTDEKLLITSLVASSMMCHCNYQFWANVDTTAQCPSPVCDTDSEDDDEPLSKRAKRVCN